MYERFIKTTYYMVFLIRIKTKLTMFKRLKFQNEILNFFKKKKLENLILENKGGYSRKFI